MMKRKRDRPSSVVEAAVPLESVSGRRGRRAAEWRSNGPVERTALVCLDPPPEHTNTHRTHGGRFQI